MKWTFGIITGPKSDTLLHTIRSIQIQNFDDDYEIIVVGGEKINLPNVRHYFFDESVKDKWITKKKNLISEYAKYDNICMMHDYVALAPKWYEHYRAFGDKWDVCMNKVLNNDLQRFRDWITWPEWCEEKQLIFLDYDTENRTKEMYISGTYFCVKKKFLLDNPFDESLCWGEWEDGEWSNRCRKKWDYKCNRKASVVLLKQKQNDHWYNTHNESARKKWNTK